MLGDAVLIVPALDEVQKIDFIFSSFCLYLEYDTLSPPLISFKMFVYILLTLDTWTKKND